MKIVLGKEGLNESWQKEFPETVSCCKCGGIAKVGLVVREETNEDGYICDLQETTGKKGGLWLHDAVAIACYWCQDCLEITVLYNQG